MVKTPTLGPAVHNLGVFGVQLRIAKGRVLDSETGNLAVVLAVKFFIVSLCDVSRSLY